MATRPRQRIDALDMTKGVLVLLMVIYHSINYSSQYELAFRYLSFLPSSFIFITGFLLSAIYAVHYDVHDSALYRRLGIRGAKLLALFTALNVLATFIQGRNPAGRTIGIRYFFTNWIDVYVVGGSRLAAFEVLLPIAYLILLAPALLWANARHRLALPVIAAGILGFCVVSEHYWGESNANLNLLCTGILGMVAGRISLDRVNALGGIKWMTSLLFAIYFMAATKYGFLFLMQVAGAMTALAFIFGWCVGKENGGRVSRWLIVQGKYSLVAYIAQIGLLQVFSRLIVRPPPFSAAWFALFLGTLIAMAVLIEVVDWARRRSKLAETAYKAVFA
jgi:peptidoglycan/LPS O-acetylase OafA/YrhL